MVALWVVAGLAFAQRRLGDPIDQLVRYSDSTDLADPVALLQTEIERGEAKLQFEPRHGYLLSLLRLLDVPISSQGLVFSKTSFQRQRISPRTPRAVYFNDNVYVGWVPDGDVIEISDVDPKKGAIFYTLDQSPAEPHFARRTECLQCHFDANTLNVPGHMLRSVLTSPQGDPLSQVNSFVIGDTAPLSDRWGGWYVEGTHSNQDHLGNSFLLDRAHPEKFDRAAGANVTDISGRFDSVRYLSPHSDIVALMVLAHQAGMHNLITRANYETRYAVDPRIGLQKADWMPQRIASVAEPLLEYMLFRNEAALKGPIAGTSGFAEEFQRAGLRDSKGRSLRDLDLKTRLLRYPCSFLIYSKAFDSLPQETKQYLWRRLSEILSGQDQSKTYATMAAADRGAVFEILRETKPEFAQFLKQQMPMAALSRLRQ